jgi:hypothetical protein
MPPIALIYGIRVGMQVFKTFCKIDESESVKNERSCP